MKKQLNASVKAYLLRGACYLILLVAVCVIPFALGQRATTKQSAVATLSTGDDPASGTWTVTGSLNTARYYHTATLLSNGMVLVAGGLECCSPNSASAELYDPASGTWTLTGSLNLARNSHTATLLPNGTVLVAGGFDSTFNASASAELYDPTSGTWTATDNLNNARVYHTATLLPNGMVVVTGGHDGPSFTPSDVLSSAELYDPASGTWTFTGSLNSARYIHTAILLSNGMVLVGGGIIGFNAFASAELYNPASGTWTFTGSLNTARFDHTATLLPNGMVLVAAGESSKDASFPGHPDRASSWSLGVPDAGCCFIFPVASAELYTPEPTPTPTPCTGRCGPTPRPRPTPHPRPTPP
jgi:Galactose oxidase, central domain